MYKPWRKTNESFSRDSLHRESRKKLDPRNIRQETHLLIGVYTLGFTSIKGVHPPFCLRYCKGYITAVRKRKGDTSCDPTVSRLYVGRNTISELISHPTFPACTRSTSSSFHSPPFPVSSFPCLVSARRGLSETLQPVHLSETGNQGGVRFTPRLDSFKEGCDCRY